MDNLDQKIIESISDKDAESSLQQSHLVGSIQASAKAKDECGTPPGQGPFVWTAHVVDSGKSGPQR